MVLLFLFSLMSLALSVVSFFFFFFNDTATTEIYTLSLHDALPICPRQLRHSRPVVASQIRTDRSMPPESGMQDRKSTRLNSSHQIISYAVFCLKKKKTVIHDWIRIDGEHAAMDLRIMSIQSLFHHR